AAVVPRAPPRCIAVVTQWAQTAAVGGTQIWLGNSIIGMGIGILLVGLIALDKEGTLNLAHQCLNTNCRPHFCNQFRVGAELCPALKHDLQRCTVRSCTYLVRRVPL